MNYYSIGECPLCDGGGRVTFARSKADGSFLVFCDECELSWSRPEAAMSTKTARPLRDLAPQGVDFPSYEDLKTEGLEHYVGVTYKAGR